jgi:hypothetical protein
MRDKVVRRVPIKCGSIVSAEDHFVAFTKKGRVVLCDHNLTDDKLFNDLIGDKTVSSCAQFFDKYISQAGPAAKHDDAYSAAIRTKREERAERLVLINSALSAYSPNNITYSWHRDTNKFNLNGRQIDFDIFSLSRSRTIMRSSLFTVSRFIKAAVQSNVVETAAAFSVEVFPNTLPKVVGSWYLTFQIRSDWASNVLPIIPAGRTRDEHLVLWLDKHEFKTKSFGSAIIAKPKGRNAIAVDAMVFKGHSGWSWEAQEGLVRPNHVERVTECGY